MFVTDSMPVPSIVFICVGSPSPHNSDDEQKMNNFIEKGIVSLKYFLLITFNSFSLLWIDFDILYQNIIFSEDQKQKVFQDGSQWYR